jgi:cell division protein FtsW
MARLKTDWILFLTVLAMVCFGLVMVYSASSMVAELRYQRFHWEPYHFIVRQLGWAAFSLIVLMYFKRLDYRRLNTPACAFSGLGIVLALLVAVYFADPRAHRWFTISGVGSVQPSEFAKPALILFLAYFLARRSQSINQKRTLLQAGLAVTMLAFMVVVADLGTAIVPVITTVVVLWVAGLEKRIMLRVVLVGVALVGVAVVKKPIRLGRVIRFVDPHYTLIGKFDPHGRIKAYVGSTSTNDDYSYQPRQSKIAVGSGGLLGVGFTEGQQKLMFLPDAHTDFIYATVGEELGLWGCTAVLGGFLVILWRGARLFVLARDDFGKYLALGVTVAIVVQAFINISVVLDMGPTKGFPLPMISFGGSSLLSTLTCLGMLLSVGEHEG